MATPARSQSGHRAHHPAGSFSSGKSNPSQNGPVKVERGPDPLSIVGAWVKLQLSTSVSQGLPTVEGFIFTYEPRLGILVLQSPAISHQNKSSSSLYLAPATSLSDEQLAQMQSASSYSSISKKQSFSFHIIKLSSIKEVIPVPTSIDPTQIKHLVPVQPVSMDKVTAKEHAALKLGKERQAKIGVGVSVQAQNLFDALAKTLPIHWKGDQIVVLDEILISPPYDINNCRPLPGKNDAENTLMRVKKVLQGERKRLGM